MASRWAEENFDCFPEHAKTSVKIFVYCLPDCGRWRWAVALRLTRCCDEISGPFLKLQSGNFRALKIWGKK